MNSSLVTIYITNHNYGKFIIQSIESVLNQSYREFELIIIDDGSTDNSLALIDGYIDNPKICLIKQNRKGLNACNNIALKEAKGKYFIRLDADDYFGTTAIEKMVKILDENKKIALVFPDYHLIDVDSNIIRTIYRHNFNADVTLFDQPAHGACTMIRKNVLTEVGGYDDEFDRQDGYDLWIKVINKHQVSNINEPLFYYRQHGSNLTKNSNKLLRTRARIKEKYIKGRDYAPLNILTIIPVRGSSIDSSSNPLRKLGEKCLIDWTVDIAISSHNVKDIIISTPDLIVQNYIDEKYSNKVLTLERKLELARINIGIEGTIEEALSFYQKQYSIPDAVLILYIDYPFKQSWQLDETVHTMQIFDVDVVDGIRMDDRFYYKHDGTGLKPIIKDGGLHLERDQLYRRVGGVHLINTGFFKEKKKMISGEIGHIHFDQVTGFQIKTEVDWEIASLLSNYFL